MIINIIVGKQLIVSDILISPNVAKRHWNTILSYRKRCEKYIIASPKSNRGWRAFIIQLFVRWLRVLVLRFYAETELVVRYHFCPTSAVVTLRISESSYVRIKRNVWTVRHLRDYRLLRVSFYVNSICWRHDTHFAMAKKKEESAYSQLSIKIRANRITQ